MQVTIEGTPGGGVSRKTIRKAAHFFAKKLMSSKLLSNTFVDIVFSKNFISKETFGYTLCISRDVPRVFSIEINNKIDKENTLKTLAHEFVHVKQYSKHELIDYSKHPTKWKYRGKIHHDKTDGDDLFLPWEIEANGLEEGLYWAYMDSIK